MLFTLVAGVVTLLLVLSLPALSGKISAVSHDGGQLLGPLSYLQTNLQGLGQVIVDKGNLIEEHVFDHNARNMGTKSMIAILIMMLVVKLVSAMGYISLIFSMVSGFTSRIRHSITGINVITGFMLINLLVLAVVLASKTFLTPRYAMTLALLISLVAAFGMADFFRAQSSKWRQRGKVLLIVILSYMFLDGLISTGASKSYLRESGEWLQQNAPSGARLFSNEESIYYYSGRNVDQNILMFAFNETRFSRLPPVGEALLYDYIAIKIGRKQKGFEQEVIAWAGSQPIHQAGNERGAKLLIFKVKK